MRSSNYGDLINAFPEAKDYAKKYSINKQEDYVTIVSRPAYKDFTPRTIKGLKKEDILQALNELACEIYRYFHSNIETQEDFDKWHYDTCKKFQDNIKECTKIDINYGKVQKILNMSFKYLFCFNDSQQYIKIGKFKFCHMPLDTYTINWFCDNILKPQKIKYSKLKEKSWSNLEYGSKEIIYSYVWIQLKIRDYLSTQNHKYTDKNGIVLTPFLAEFYIWPEQKFKEACKDLTNMTLCQDSYPQYHDAELEAICKDTIKILKRVNEK